MYLHSIKIQGFRRLYDISATFKDATFLIGPNNGGKSSILKAIGYLLGNKKIDEENFYAEVDPDTGEQNTAVEEIVIEAEFRNVSNQAEEWRGFRGRVFTYSPADDETGKCIFYKKVWKIGQTPKTFLKSKKRTLQQEYASISTPQELIEAGINSEVVLDLFGDPSKNLSAKEKQKLDAIDILWDISEDEEWFENPGGIPGNVLSRLPRYLIIPADAASYEIEKPTGTLQKTLNELFKEVRDKSDNYSEIQNNLFNLSNELDPKDEDTDFGKMITDLNEVMASVFTNASVHVSADLSDPDDVLIPKFNVEMESNIKTRVSFQGTGLIRAAVFGLLRFRKQWEEKQEQDNERGLVICFEEPEIFLHPSASNQMRDTIYQLAHKNCQIIASTHSPYMIDLSRKPRQMLIQLKQDGNKSSADLFSISEAFQGLQDDDKTYIKMLSKIDDYVSRVFFCEQAVIVEGDTEDVLIKQTLNLLPKEQYLKLVSQYEVIKARGKPVIKSLVLYLQSMGIKPIVIHDADTGIKGAEVFNAPIKEAINDDDRLYVVEDCIEDLLGYTTASEKPYQAYKHTETWDNDYSNIPTKWRELFEKVFNL